MAEDGIMRINGEVLKNDRSDDRQLDLEFKPETTGVGYDGC